MASDPKQAETREKLTLGRRHQHWGVRAGNGFQWLLSKDRSNSNRNSQPYSLKNQSTEEERNVAGSPNFCI